MPILSGGASAHAGQSPNQASASATAARMRFSPFRRPYPGTLKRGKLDTKRRLVYPARMLKNLESTGGLIYTSTVLLELVEMGLERDTQAYPLTQRAAMKTWETGRPFRETLREEADAAGLKIDEARLDEVCRPERFVTRLDGMFAKLAELK